MSDDWDPKRTPHLQHLRGALAVMAEAVRVLASEIEDPRRALSLVKGHATDDSEEELIAYEDSIAALAADIDDPARVQELLVQHLVTETSLHLRQTNWVSYGVMGLKLATDRLVGERTGDWPKLPRPQRQ